MQSDEIKILTNTKSHFANITTDMTLPFFIARRYLFSKKSTNAINLITGIAIAGIAIGSAALILILSVFNGFEGLMRSYLDTFNPDIKLLPTSGKFFDVSEEMPEAIKQIEGVEFASVVIEDVVLLEYKDDQQVGVLKGVDESYLRATTLSEAIVEGDIELNSNDRSFKGIIGKGIQNNLDISLKDQFSALKVYVPNRNVRGPFDRDFKSRPVEVTSVFAIQNERDNQYVICDYSLVSGLMDLRGKASAIELKVNDEVSEKRIRAEITALYPDQFIIQNRYQQDESFLKTMNIEKWTAYLIFGFTMILIIFNLVGSLWMIVLDKKKDLSVLQSYGATKSFIKRIFLSEGLLISLIGFSIGLVFALLFYVLQKTIGIITVPQGYNITSYPIELEVFDVVIIFITVIVLGVLASLPAAIRASKISAYVRIE